MNPFAIHKILVPIDLSQNSLNALDTAVSLAHRHGATLFLLNVIEPGFNSFSEDSAFEKSPDNFSDVLTALAGAIQHANGLKPKIIQAEGNVTDTIIKTSLRTQSDLIVMGTHGASGYRDGFVGSNTYSVIKYAVCPVLTVPSHRKFLSFGKVVFPVRPVTGALARYDIVCHFLAPSSVMEVLGLSYGTMEKETNLLKKIIEEIKEPLDRQNVKTRPVWGTGRSIAEDVLEFVQRSSPELIVLTSVLDFISKPDFIGPHTQKIIHCSRVPLLNIKKVGVPFLI